MHAPYELLRAARVLLDMKAEDLAKKAGVSKRSLVRIEACESVSLETAIRVQQALEREGIEFLLETKVRGPGLSIRKGKIGRPKLESD
jgi:Helix-turn-helix.